MDCFGGLLNFKTSRPTRNLKKDLIFEDYKILSLALAGFILWLAWSGLNVVYISALYADIGVIVVNAFAALFGAMIAPLIFPWYSTIKLFHGLK